MTPSFTFADFERANAVWGCNCGPSALAAICGLTLDAVRLHMPTFEAKSFTPPTMMFAALRSVGTRWSWDSVLVNDARPVWPSYGLCLVQWEGPWSQLDAPFRARELFTHWVGVGPLYTSNGSPISGETCIWDVNTLDIGNGWAPLAAWARATVPTITSSIPGATGGWHLTHAIEVERHEAVAQRGVRS